MEKVIGRDAELSVLESVWNRTNGKTVIMYGRRRIGKSTILRRFCKDKRAIYVTCIRGSLNNNLHSFSTVLTEFTGKQCGPYEYLQDPLDRIRKICTEDKTLVVIDELPYLLNSDVSSASLLQHFVDYVEGETDSMVVVCGSSISVMKKETTDYDRPLYGRFRTKIEVRQLSVSDCKEFHPEMSDIDRLKLYLTVGGVPMYHTGERCSTYREFVERHFIFPAADMVGEAEAIISAEFAPRDRYLAVINAVSDGKVSLKEITDVTGLDRAACLNCLNNLTEARIIGTTHPMANAPKRPMYRIEDNMVAFCQTIVRKLEEYPLNDYESKFDVVKTDVDTFLGRRFEDLCAEYTVKHWNCLEIGKWWGMDSNRVMQEIDIMATVVENKTRVSLYGECKFTKGKVSKSILEELIKRSKLPRDNCSRRYVLYSVSGFSATVETTAGERDDITLIGLRELMSPDPCSRNLNRQCP